MLRSPTLALATLMLVLMLSSSCGGPHESSVFGTVYLEGQPLRTGILGNVQRMGTVTFFPDSGAAVYGQIAADGTYRLNTGSEQGLKSGEYRVTVVVTDNPPTAPGQTPSVGRRITPEKYSLLDQTDLVVTVKPGSNQIDLPLENN